MWSCFAAPTRRRKPKPINAVNWSRRRRFNTLVRRNKQSIFLLEVIVVDILSRLPVKSLMNFKRVSKRWRSLISSERFIKLQFERSTKLTSLAHHRVIFNGYGDSSILKQCSLLPLLKQQSLVPDTMYDPTCFLPDIGYVLGHCNGLLCIRKFGSLFLWNPATRISIKLPKTTSITDQSTYCGFGFGWDEASGAYIVVVIGGNRIGEFYSSKTNSWKTMEHNEFRLSHGWGEFLGGIDVAVGRSFVYVESLASPVSSSHES